MEKISKIYNIIAGITAIILGVFFVILPCIEWQGFGLELTFISNFFSGIFYFVSGVLILLKIKIPHFLFLMPSTLLIIVMLGSIIFQQGFEGSFLFLHLINPLLSMIYTLFLTKQVCKLRFIPLTIIPIAIYYLFSQIHGIITQNYIHSFLNPIQMGTGIMIAIIIGGALGSIAFAYGFYFLNKVIVKFVYKN